jgi:hypothetical protein
MQRCAEGFNIGVKGLNLNIRNFCMKVLIQTHQINWDILINPLNAQLNPICHLLALLGAHPILHVSR